MSRVRDRDAERDAGLVIGWGYSQEQRWQIPSVSDLVTRTERGRLLGRCSVDSPQTGQLCLVIFSLMAGGQVQNLCGYKWPSPETPAGTWGIDTPGHCTLRIELSLDTPHQWYQLGRSQTTGRLHPLVLIPLRDIILLTWLTVSRNK